MKTTVSPTSKDSPERQDAHTVPSRDTAALGLQETLKHLSKLAPSALRYPAARP